MHSKAPGQMGWWVGAKNEQADIGSFYRRGRTLQKRSMFTKSSLRRAKTSEIFQSRNISTRRCVASVLGRHRHSVCYSRAAAKLSDSTVKSNYSLLAVALPYQQSSSTQSLVHDFFNSLVLDFFLNICKIDQKPLVSEQSAHSSSQLAVLAASTFPFHSVRRMYAIQFGGCMLHQILFFICSFRLRHQENITNNILYVAMHMHSESGIHIPLRSVILFLQLQIQAKAFAFAFHCVRFGRHLFIWSFVSE